MNNESKLYGALSYFFGLITGVIMLVIKPKDEFVKFHAMQSILLNIVIIVLAIGLIIVSVIVGLIPAGGGCKEMLARWLDTDEAKNDPHYAPLKVFDIIGYGKTATSPVEAEPMKYLKPAALHHI